MHKQFKKFGFFVSKNLRNEETDGNINDKLVKYLYKNETGFIEKVRKKPKIRNTHGREDSVQKSSKKYEDEGGKHLHKYRKKSNESIQTKYKKKELLINPYASETEIYYISPEEIKKHRKKRHKSKDRALEKSSETKVKHIKHRCPECYYETERLRNKRKAAEDIVKFIKEHNFKEKNKDIGKEDYQWLTKKEIFKLISNSECVPKNSSASSSFLKRFFVFDKQQTVRDKLEFNVVENEQPKKLSRYKEDKKNSIFIPMESSLANTVKKPERNYRNEDGQVDVICSQKSSKHHYSSTTPDDQNLSKLLSVIDAVVSPEKMKRRKEKNIADFKLEDPSNIQKEVERTKVKRRSKEIENAITSEDFKNTQNESCHTFSQIEIETKPKIRKIKNKDQDSSNVEKENSDLSLKPKNRVNPIRHKFCLVKNTFSVVEIPPIHPPSCHVEKKKKSKAFKKYYKYTNIGDECETRTETYYTYSDSNKIYQDISEQSIEEPTRKRHKHKDKKSPTESKRELNAETHVSAITINPETDRYVMKTSQSKDSDKKGKKNKFLTRKSKIPVLSNTSRMVASLKETLMSPKSYKEKVIQAVSSPRSRKETEASKEIPTSISKDKNKSELVKEKIQSPQPFKSKNVDSVKEKHTNSKPFVEKNFEVMKEKPSNSKPKEKYTATIKEKPSFKPLRDNSIEPLKDRVSRSKAERNKNNEPVKAVRNKSNESVKEGTSDSKPVRHKSIEPVKDKVASSTPIKDKNIESVKDRASNFIPICDKNIEAVKDKASCSKPTKVKTVEAGKEKSSDIKAYNHKDRIVKEIKENVVNPKPSKIPSLNRTNKTKISKQESKISESSNTSKQSRRAVDKNSDLKKEPVRNVRDKFVINKNRNVSSSPPPTYRRRSADGSVTSSHKSSKSPSRLSTGASSSLWDRSSKKSNKTSLTSKSDTKLQRTKKTNNDRKYKGFERSSTKASLSNSTFGDKSLDSSSRATSFFLTKTFKDDDKLTRWQKRKIYADSVRKKNQKPAIIPPQVLEVRYLTITNSKNDGTLFINDGNLHFDDSDTTMNPQLVNKSEHISPCESETINSSSVNKHEIISTTPENEHEAKLEEGTIMKAPNESKSKKEFYENDLPPPCLEITENEKFEELFLLPIDKALNEILHENYNFLKKDFSYTIGTEKSLSSDDDQSSFNDIPFDNKFDDWYDFRITDDGSESETSCCNKIPNETKEIELNINSQDHIVDSCSAPRSEESGYSTIKSRPVSRSFFERPDIKALLKPPCGTKLDTYWFEVQIETQNSSNHGFDIHSIESKSLQTTVECSQKSVQIKLSQEDVLEAINSSEGIREVSKNQNEGKGQELEPVKIDLDCEEKNQEPPETNKYAEKQEQEENGKDCEELEPAEIYINSYDSEEQKVEEVKKDCEKQLKTDPNSVSESSDGNISKEASDRNPDLSIQTSKSGEKYNDMVIRCGGEINNNETREVNEEKYNGLKKKKRKLSFLSCIACVSRE